MDLLIWQRVNKTWQAAIQRSSRIQEKLFFKVRPCEDEYEFEDAVFNPFMNRFLVRRRAPKKSFIEKASHATASWKQMAITNQSITELELFNTSACENGRVLQNVRSIACDSGITIGQLANDQKERHFSLLNCGDDDYDEDKSIWISGLALRDSKGECTYPPLCTIFASSDTCTQDD